MALTHGGQATEQGVYENNPTVFGSSNVMNVQVASDNA
jgi:hypothetical protein